MPVSRAKPTKKGRSIPSTCLVFAVKWPATRSGMGDCWAVAGMAKKTAPSARAAARWRKRIVISSPGSPCSRIAGPGRRCRDQDGEATSRLPVRPVPRSPEPDIETATGRAMQRDLIGYGLTPPTLAWPGGAHLAVSLVVNYEEGAELSIEAGDGATERIGEV